MQDFDAKIAMPSFRRRLPWGALCAFEATARLGSLKAAGESLGLSASAVSHQVQRLETALEVALFLRRNNALDLTVEGQRFLEAVGPALRSVERSAEALARRGEQISIRLGLSLAVRWLIPALAEFRRLHPRIRVQVETTHLGEIRLEEGLDLAITYDRVPQAGTPLLSDLCFPLVSPRLLAERGIEICKLPLLAASEDDWDWHAWSKVGECDPACLTILDRFDNDDAALVAAAGGFGVALSPLWMAARELRSGALVTVPEQPPAALGGYRLLRTQPPRPAVDRFEGWLVRQAAALESEGALLQTCCVDGASAYAAADHESLGDRHVQGPDVEGRRWQGQQRDRRGG